MLNSLSVRMGREMGEEARQPLPAPWSSFLSIVELSGSAAMEYFVISRGFLAFTIRR